MKLELSWPPASLSGHANGNWYGKSGVTKQWRNGTWAIAKAHKKPELDATGDIYVRLSFTPPDRKSDRCNFYNRCKPILDGLADALGVNDKRFVPIMDETSFNEPCKPGKVVLEVWQ